MNPKEGIKISPPARYFKIVPKDKTSKPTTTKINTQDSPAMMNSNVSIVTSSKSSAEVVKQFKHLPNVSIISSSNPTSNATKQPKDCISLNIISPLKGLAVGKEITKQVADETGSSSTNQVVLQKPLGKHILNAAMELAGIRKTIFGDEEQAKPLKQISIVQSRAARAEANCNVRKEITSTAQNKETDSKILFMHPNAIISNGTAPSLISQQVIKKKIIPPKTKPIVTDNKYRYISKNADSNTNMNTLTNTVASSVPTHNFIPRTTGSMNFPIITGVPVSTVSTSENVQVTNNYTNFDTNANIANPTVIYTYHNNDVQNYNTYSNPPVVSVPAVKVTNPSIVVDSVKANVPKPATNRNYNTSNITILNNQTVVSAASGNIKQQNDNSWTDVAPSSNVTNAELKPVNSVSTDTNIAPSVTDAGVDCVDDDDDDDDRKSIICLDDCYPDEPKNKDVLQEVLGRENYNTLLSALCTIKNLRIRGKALAAFFANAKTYRSVECQTNSSQLSSETVENEQFETKHNPVKQPMLYIPQQHQSIIFTEQHPVQMKESTTMKLQGSYYTMPEEQIMIDYPVVTQTVPHTDICLSEIQSDQQGMNLDSSTAYGNQGEVYIEQVLNQQEQQNFGQQDVLYAEENEYPLDMEPCMIETQIVYSPMEKTTEPYVMVEPGQQVQVNSASQSEVEIPSEQPSPEQPSPEQASPITSAAENKQQPNYENVLEYDSNGLLEIHRAVLKQDVDSIWLCGEQLRRLGRSVDQRTQPDGYTALQLALLRGCGENIMRLLLWLGANALEQDGSGRPALLLALLPRARRAPTDQGSLRQQSLHFIQVLHAEHRQKLHDACKQTDSEGLTSLMHCAINSWAEQMELLLRHTPLSLVDLPHHQNKMTALHMAMVAYSNAVTTGIPLDAAQRCIQLLKAYGASESAQDADGLTPHKLCGTTWYNVDLIQPSGVPIKKGIPCDVKIIILPKEDQVKPMSINEEAVIEVKQREVKIIAAHKEVKKKPQSPIKTNNRIDAKEKVTTELDLDSLKAKVNEHVAEYLKDKNKKKSYDSSKAFTEKIDQMRSISKAIKSVVDDKPTGKTPSCLPSIRDMTKNSSSPSVKTQTKEAISSNTEKTDDSKKESKQTGVKIIKTHPRIDIAKISEGSVVSEHLSGSILNVSNVVSPLKDSPSITTSPKLPNKLINVSVVMSNFKIPKKTTTLVKDVPSEVIVTSSDTTQDSLVKQNRGNTEETCITKKTRKGHSVKNLTEKPNSEDMAKSINDDDKTISSPQGEDRSISHLSREEILSSLISESLSPTKSVEDDRTQMSPTKRRISVNGLSKNKQKRRRFKGSLDSVHKVKKRSKKVAEKRKKVVNTHVTVKKLKDDGAVQKLRSSTTVETKNIKVVPRQTSQLAVVKKVQFDCRDSELLKDMGNDPISLIYPETTRTVSRDDLVRDKSLQPRVLLESFIKEVGISNRVDFSFPIFRKYKREDLKAGSDYETHSSGDAKRNVAGYNKVNSIPKVKIAAKLLDKLEQNSTAVCPTREKKIKLTTATPHEPNVQSDTLSKNCNTSVNVESPIHLQLNLSPEKGSKRNKDGRKSSASDSLIFCPPNVVTNLGSSLVKNKGPKRDVRDWMNVKNKQNADSPTPTSEDKSTKRKWVSNNKKSQIGNEMDSVKVTTSAVIHKMPNKEERIPSLGSKANDMTGNIVVRGDPVLKRQSVTRKTNWTGKRRHSLDSIEHDLELIQKGVAMQENGQMTRDPVLNDLLLYKK